MTGMTALESRGGWLAQLDRWAIGVSGLCVVHCLATSVLLALASTAGGMLGSPLIHEGGLVLAIAMGAVGLGRGIVSHGMMMPSAMGALGLGIMTGAVTLPHGAAGLHPETVWTMIGVGLLAFGHHLNARA
jgi:hypothetical protein